MDSLCIDSGPQEWHSLVSANPLRMVHLLCLGLIGSMNQTMSCVYDLACGAVEKQRVEQEVESVKLLDLHQIVWAAVPKVLVQVSSRT